MGALSALGLLGAMRVEMRKMKTGTPQPASSPPLSVPLLRLSMSNRHLRQGDPYGVRALP